MSRTICLLLPVLLASLAIAAAAREWTDDTGQHVVEAEFIERQGDVVRLRRADGTAISVPLDRLSRQDQQYVQSLERQDGAGQGGAFAVERALGNSTAAEFADEPLEDVLQSLADTFRIRILIDRSAIADAGLATDMPISATLETGTLADHLRSILKPHGLSWAIRHEVLMITTAEVAETLMETRVYRITRPMVRDELYDGLIQHLMTNVAPATWVPMGGPGAAEALRYGVVVVRQSSQHHHEIQRQNPELLQPVRHPGPVALPILEEIAVAAALHQPTSLEFVRTPLQEVIGYLRKMSGIEIAIDEAKLADAGVSVQTPVTINVRGIRLESALSLLLEPLGLMWTADAMGVRVTTPEAGERLQLMRYQVDGLHLEPNMSDLIDVITTTVSPSDWQAFGGAGSMQSGIDGTLDVAQSFRVHRQIAQLLADLGAARAAIE